MNASANARLAALRSVASVLDLGRTLSDTGFPVCGLNARDAGFARRLAYGVLRWYGALDWLAGNLLQRPLKKRDADLHRLILLGLYQLWREDVPPHAAVHATAACARDLGKPWATGLVNALLRRFQREREAWLVRLASHEARFSHPGWLLGRLREDWPNDWAAIVEANNCQAPLWLRRNRRRKGSENITARLEQAGFGVRTCNPTPDALLLEPAAPVHDIPGFDEGLLSVQDAAAQLAAPLLQPQAGERILDACAAPGGKACHLLELEPGLELTAVDLTADRTGLIRESLRRLGLTAQVVEGDATRPEDWWDGQPFDKILLDAPCSATGVIRRHPEIKWLRSEQQVRAARDRQRLLLDRLWPLLGAEGMLVYATCSVLHCENDRQVEAFLGRHSDAHCIGPAFSPGRQLSPGRQILPGEDGMDGFYYAVLRKGR